MRRETSLVVGGAVCLAVAVVAGIAIPAIMQYQCGIAVQAHVSLQEQVEFLKIALISQVCSMAVGLVGIVLLMVGMRGLRKSGSQPAVMSDADASPRQRKWFRRPWFKIATFVLLMPVWAVIVWTDPDERRPMKIFAFVMLALGACFAALNDRPEGPRDSDSVEMVKFATVLVAAQDVPAGTVLKAGHLKPANTISVQNPGHCIQPETMAQAVGRKFRFPVRAGDPVFWADLEDAESAGSAKARN